MFSGVAVPSIICALLRSCMNCFMSKQACVNVGPWTCKAAWLPLQDLQETNLSGFVLRPVVPLW